MRVSIAALSGVFGLSSAFQLQVPRRSLAAPLSLSSQGMTYTSTSTAPMASPIVPYEESSAMVPQGYNQEILDTSTDVARWDIVQYHMSADTGAPIGRYDTGDFTPVHPIARERIKNEIFADEATSRWEVVQYHMSSDTGAPYASYTQSFTPDHPIARSRIRRG